MNRFILYLGIFFVFLPAYELEAYTTFEGAPRWWNVPDTNPMKPRVVNYYINWNGTLDCEGEFDAVQRAFQTWQKILTTYVSLIYSTVYTLTFNLKEEG